MDIQTLNFFSIAQLTPNRNSFEIILTVEEGETYNFGKLDVTKLKKMNTEVLWGYFHSKRATLIMEA